MRCAFIYDAFNDQSSRADTLHTEDQQAIRLITNYQLTADIYLQE